MERVRKFTRNGKNFLYIDFADFKSLEELLDLIEIVKPMIEKYPPRSLYTIANIENIRFDSKIRAAATSYLEHNNPYIRYGAVIGFDGIKKAIITALFRETGRENMYFAFSEEGAIEWLLRQD